MRFLYLTIGFLILSLSAIHAQVADRKLSVDYNQARIGTIVQDLNQKSGFHFYYDPILLDSLRITAKIDNQTISFILEKIFETNNVNFVIIKTNIFLTQGKTIQTEIPLAHSQDGHAVLPNQNYKPTSPSENTLTSVTPNKIYEVGIKTNIIKKGTAVIVGYVRDLNTGTAISGARIYVENANLNTTSNEEGLYSLTLPYGSHSLIIKAGGNRDSKRQIIVYDDGKLNIDLKEKIISLEEVRIVSNKESNVKRLEMGVSELDIKTLKKIPAVFGEVDILRAILTLPGVQSVGEASTGFNVRGGSADQNLILFNDATIYNPSHFFGFFSAFNPDVVKDIQLYKSSIPEKFGGRLASVLEVNGREGDKSKITGSAGIGLLTSRFNIEGPIDSGKTSFIFGGRGTYSNWMLRLLPESYKHSRASFYDFNLGINHEINPKNSISAFAYYSKDNFKLNSDTNYNYSNKNISLKWKSQFNSQLNGALTVGSDYYEYSIKSEINPVNAYQLDFNINQTNLKYDMLYVPNLRHTINFGVSSIFYKLNPGNYNPRGNESIVTPNIVPAEQALESAIFIGDQFNVTDNLAINAGLRFSIYNYLGPQSVRRYAENLPLSEATLVNAENYGKNQFINTYGGPEFRFSARYNFKSDFSIKAAYNSLRQYIHLLSNTTAIAPTDIWKLSDPNIKPQLGSQISLGLYKNFNQQEYETSVEVYYKNINNFLDYKNGASLVLNKHIETDVMGTKGKAYGLELFMKKNYGKFNGWISYAYSRTLLKMDDITSGTLVNGGNYYPASYDKPHAFNFTSNYRFKYRYNFSLNVTYSTGRPITLPTAKYFYAGSERVFYSERNAYRIPDYFRSDLSFNIEGNHKVNQRTHNSWTIGLYNVTGRKNPYSVYYTQEGGVINGYKLSIFASVIPFVNFNIKF